MRAASSYWFQVPLDAPTTPRPSISAFMGFSASLFMFLISRHSFPTTDACTLSHPFANASNSSLKRNPTLKFPQPSTFIPQPFCKHTSSPCQIPAGDVLPHSQIPPCNLPLRSLCFLLVKVFSFIGVLSVFHQWLTFPFAALVRHSRLNYASCLPLLRHFNHIPVTEPEIR